MASLTLALLVAFSNCSVFGVHTTELRFCLVPVSFSSVFIIVLCSSVFDVDYCERKAKDGAKESLFKSILLKNEIM